MVDCVAKFTSLVRARDKFPQLQVLVNGVSSVNYLNLDACAYPGIFVRGGPGQSDKKS